MCCDILFGRDSITKPKICFQDGSEGRKIEKVDDTIGIVERTLDH